MADLALPFQQLLTTLLSLSKNTAWHMEFPDLMDSRQQQTIQHNSNKFRKQLPPRSEAQALI
jgi:hypothetical protein